MDQQTLLQITAWSKKHKKDLEELYEQYKDDTGDYQTSFVEFCAGLYFNLKDEKL